MKHHSIQTIVFNKINFPGGLTWKTACDPLVLLYIYFCPTAMP